MKKFNEKLNEDLANLGRQLAEIGAATAREAAGAASGVLKGLAEELGTLGERLGRWVETRDEKANDSKRARDATGNGGV